MAGSLVEIVVLITGNSGGWELVDASGEDDAARRFSLPEAKILRACKRYKVHVHPPTQLTTSAPQPHLDSRALGNEWI